ncbi:MAG: Multifunctional protein [Candidatus Parcubacteria bacterium]|jgi:tRNA nucleotidyltransferase (CCA-adding enzyme)
MIASPKKIIDPAAFRGRFEACAPVLRDAVTRLAEGVKKEGGGTVRALLVGGAVRDLLLGRDVADMDVEVYGIPAQRLQEMLEQLFPGRVYLVGAAFGVFKIPLDGGHDLDVSLPRRESKIGKGHKGFTVEGDPTMSMEDAARRRDFTVNSIMADPLTSEVIDLFHGIADLEANILRVTDAEAFGDDPLRVYRAVQFTARFTLIPEQETLALLQKMVTRGDCDELPKERITEEMRKLLLQAQQPSRGFALMQEIGLIARDYPELQDLLGVNQEPDWHPEGDVWVHTLLVLDRAAALIRQADRGLLDDEALHVMLGCLCHDLGKPITTEVIDGRIRSRGHEPAGEAPTASLLARWCFGVEAERAAIVVATEHLKPGMLFRALQEGKMTSEQYTNAVRKLLRRIHPVSWRVLVTSAEADFRGRTLPESSDPVYAAGDLFIQTLKSANLEHGLPRPLLQGRDLLEIGIPPGPEMGRVIRLIEEARDKGEVKTKKEAEKYVRNLLYHKILIVKNT